MYTKEPERYTEAENYVTQAMKSSGYSEFAIIFSCDSDQEDAVDVVVKYCNEYGTVITGMWCVWKEPNGDIYGEW